MRRGARHTRGGQCEGPPRPARGAAGRLTSGRRAVKANWDLTPVASGKSKCKHRNKKEKRTRPHRRQPALSPVMPPRVPGFEGRRPGREGAGLAGPTRGGPSPASRPRLAVARTRPQPGRAGASGPASTRAFSPRAQPAPAGLPFLARPGRRSVQRSKERTVGVQPSREREQHRAFPKVQGK
jgi:hypothetical protein